jgi:UDP-glucose 4-epimerase
MALERERGMNWLVTGGCGFLGTALVRALVAEGGHSVRVVDNLAVGERDDLEAVTPFEEVTEVGPMRPDSPVELLVGDILDEELALRAAQGADVIVHLAANTGVMPSIEDPRADCMSNVVGTLNYLEAARHGGVGRFVFASSGGTTMRRWSPTPSPRTGRASWPGRATAPPTSARSA